MTDYSILSSLLQHWQQQIISGSLQLAENKHLDDETCYLLTLPNALSKASAQTVRHLSSCPVCLGRWSDWLAAATLSVDNEGGESLMSYGMLEAAASCKRVEGLASVSVCGSFKLSIFPKQDDLNSALITVEYLADDNDRVEGHRFIVLAGDGNIILDGQLRSGRLARTTKEFQSINLDRWTIIEEAFPQAELN